MKSIYSKCIERSQRAHWELEHFQDIQLDFTRTFLPEGLARTHELEALTAAEKVRLNQIRGHAYAYIFRFVEEYIVDLVDDLKSHGANNDRLEALGIFSEEERKHQALFSMFEERFRAGFPVACEVVGGMEDVANVLLGSDRFSLLLLTAMLEWLTQSHYLAYFDDEEASSIDEGFRDLFRLHWVEEAQHARLDAAETHREAESRDLASRAHGVSGFLAMCDQLKFILELQANLDLASLERLREQPFVDDDRNAILHQQKRSYAYTFIVLGLRNRHFRKLVQELVPTGLQQVDAYIEQLDLDA